MRDRAGVAEIIIRPWWPVSDFAMNFLHGTAGLASDRSGCSDDPTPADTRPDEVN